MNGDEQMKVKLSEVYVGALIRADFLCSYRDEDWHEVYEINKQGAKIYIAVEGFKGIVLPYDYEVDIL